MSRNISSVISLFVYLSQVNLTDEERSRLAIIGQP